MLKLYSSWTDALAVVELLGGGHYDHNLTRAAKLLPTSRSRYQLMLSEPPIPQPTDFPTPLPPF